MSGSKALRSIAEGRTWKHRMDEHTVRIEAVGDDIRGAVAVSNTVTGRASRMSTTTLIRSYEPFDDAT